MVEHARIGQHPAAVVPLGGGGLLQRTDLSGKELQPVVVPHGAGAEIAVAGVVKSLDEQTREATVELTVTCGDEKVLGRCRAVARLD